MDAVQNNLHRISTPGLGAQSTVTQNTFTQNTVTQNAVTQNTVSRNIGAQNIGSQNIGSQNIGSQNIGSQGRGYTFEPGLARLQFGAGVNLPPAIAAAPETKGARNPAPDAINGVALSISRGYEQLVSSFQRLDELQAKLLIRASRDIRPLVEAQIMSGRINLQAQVVTKAADAFASTLKRLQQLGGGS